MNDNGSLSNAGVSESEKNASLTQIVKNNILSKKSTIVRDPIHGFIDLSHYDFLIRIVQTAPFQRLRRLSQLGVTAFVYPSATHSRFNHSLGAMQLFVRIFDQLYKDSKNDSDYDKLRMTGVAAVLLHDIGHGPFSHASEGVFRFDHEDISRQIIESTEIKDILQDPGISTNDIVAIISKRADGKMKLLSQLISSQLDVDRLDYLARDVYFTGVGFGGVDLDRIIRTMTIHQEEGFLKGYPVIEEKGKHAIEAFLMTRNLMYDDVYYHKTTRCVEKIIEAIFKRVIELSTTTSNGNKFNLPPELEFIKKVRPDGSKSEITYSDILPLDDHYAYSLFQRWSRDNSTDIIIRDLSTRILERRLLKSAEIPYEHLAALHKQESAIEGIVYEKSKLNPKYYTMIDLPKDRPYQPVRSPTSNEEIQESLKKNIYIKLKEGGVREISEVSDIVSALTKKKQLVRIYYPEEVRQDISDIISKIKE